MCEFWKKIKDWCADNDWWYLAVVSLALMSLCVLWALWGLLIICVGIAVTVAVAEITFLKWLNISVSDNFREWRQSHPMQSTIILSLMALVMILLIYHFTRKPNL